ncbi:MAG TPA: hypothetical protein VGL94_15930 [Ktedonobacteraceae bacterium]|jgi:hypothetical protein
MQDSEKDYPEQPIRFRRAQRSTDDGSLAADGSEYTPEEIQLPSHGLLYALSAGVLGGLLAALIPIAITFMNASLYYEASRQADKMSYNLALTLTGLACLSSFIDLVLSFVVGYIVGRIAVLRKLGLLAGALVGAITYLGNSIPLYLPNYPGKIVSTTPPSSGNIFAGILTIIFILLIYSAVGALMALWGTWTVTRKHPYYQRQEQE